MHARAESDASRDSSRFAGQYVSSTAVYELPVAAKLDIFDIELDVVDVIDKILTLTI